MHFYLTFGDMIVAQTVLRLLAVAGLAHWALFTVQPETVFRLYHETNLSRDAHVWATAASNLNLFVR